MQEDKIHFYQHMKSVAINLCPNETEDDYIPGSGLLISWLEEYDRWFKSALDIFQGEHAYALYNRQITLFGKNLLKVPDILSKLAPTVISMGFALSITVDIMELYEDYNIVKFLCDNYLLSSIGIYTDNAGKLSELTDMESFLMQITELKRPIGLIGSVKLLRRNGILGRYSLNSMDITLYPLPYEDSIQVDRVYPYFEKSCANHLQLYINPDGNIYPCLGLLGLEDYSIANIKDGMAGFNLIGERAKTDLLKLYLQGPDLEEEIGYHQSTTSLPWICEQHRMELQKDA